ncbi:MAG: dienelactone hydrolase family protein [Pseudohongiellaceae bacterium]
MQKLIVSDIFGKTKQLEKIAQLMTGDVTILDPYGGKYMAFSNEDEAYQYFSSKVGLEQYALMLFEKIASEKNNLQLIGFSVGASAIWMVSEHKELTNIADAVCFYGSQIRHYTGLTPIFSTQLIFPDSEKHFDVSKLINAVEKKENVNVVKTEYSHGFMNKQSLNFNQAGFDQFLTWLVS